MAKTPMKRVVVMMPTDYIQFINDTQTNYETSAGAVVRAAIKALQAVHPTAMKALVEAEER